MTKEANILSFDEARASVSAHPRGAHASYTPKRVSSAPAPRFNGSPASSRNGEHRFGSVQSRRFDSRGRHRRSDESASSWRSCATDGPARSSRNRDDALRGSADSSRNDRPTSSRRQMGSYSEEGERRREMRRYDRTHASGSGARNRSQGTSSRRDDSVVSEARRKVRSSRVDRQYDRTIGREEAARASQEQSGSRAAVYEMKMGREHRRSAHMQERSGRSSSRAGVSSFFERFNFMRAGAMVLLLFGALALFVYEPAANWYNETRSLQQLQAQYELTAENYNHVKADVDYLSTEEGMADYAHQQLGWVRSGEHSVTVKGLSSESQDNSSSTSVVQALSQGNAQAKTPDTWYSGVLDVVFGYDDGN